MTMDLHEQAGAPPQHALAIPTDGALLQADLQRPARAQGLVIFAHGSGSSRFSSRNRLVAAELHRCGLATLLFDLLTPEESRREAGGSSAQLRFNVPFLARRLLGVTDWLRSHEVTRELAYGYFGASTGAAAALIAAAQRPADIAAVVSRGGRPDLAQSALGSVRAPTLLIVGGDDWSVLELNQQALRLLRCAKQLQVVDGATHLFEEPGALEDVAELAAGWFSQHLRAPARPHPAQ